MDELLKLAERCEKATGPDREIDRDMALLFGMYNQPEDLDCFEDPAEAVVGGGGQTWAPPQWTASLDAAMTLKDDWLLDYIQETDEGYTTAGLYRRNGIVLSHDRATGNGKTPALALCAAALRARANPSLDGS